MKSSIDHASGWSAIGYQKYVVDGGHERCGANHKRTWNTGTRKEQTILAMVLCERTDTRAHTQ